MKTELLIAGGVLITTALASTQRNETANPRELGQVTWLRSDASALTKAKAENKPVLVLFQEIPGCSTCQNYGNQVLSHPLVVESIESLFVPLAIHNNSPGDDEKALKSFNEPAWNNPVVRIIATDRTELASRLADDYSVAGLARTMVAALEKTKKDIPGYLRLLAEESTARKLGVGKAILATHCFWEGEATLGQLQGVISTRSGFIGSDEVVEVEFDPRTLNYVDLIKNAKGTKCISRVYTRDDSQQRDAAKVVGSDAVHSEESVRPDKEPKYYLLHTSYSHVPMTSLQSARVNAAIRFGKDPNEFLSPRQLDLWRKIENSPAIGWPVVVDATDLRAAWDSVQAVAKP